MGIKEIFLIIVILLLQITLSYTNDNCGYLQVPNGGETTIDIKIHNDVVVRLKLDFIHSETVLKFDTLFDEHFPKSTCDNNQIIAIPHHKPNEFILCRSTMNVFGKCPIDIFYYSLITNTEKKMSSSLSFAHKFKNKKHSIIHQLYNNKYISKRQVAFKSKIHGNNNKIYLGEYPENFIDDYDHSMSLKVYKNATEWKFKVHSIKVGLFSREYTNQHAYIFSKDSDIMVDDDTFEWLVNEVFEEHFNKGDCKIKELISRDTICCDVATYRDFKGVKFVIQGYEIEFPKEECFWCSEMDPVCYLNIVKINKEMYPNDFVWKIGYTFYQRFINVLDYDKHTITFYSKSQNSFTYTGEGVGDLNEYDNDDEDDTELSLLITKYIIYIGICLLIPGVFSLMYINMKYLK